MNNALVAGVVLAVVIAAAAVFVGGIGGLRVSTSVVEGEQVEIASPPADGSRGVVLNAYKPKDGWSLFGWEITSSEWEAQVMFVPPAECLEPADEIVVATGPCARVPAEGRLAGGGTDAAGNRLWTVAVEVSEACHDALEPNDEWPSAKPECAGTG